MDAPLVTGEHASTVFRSGHQLLCFAALLALNANGKIFLVFAPFLAKKYDYALADYSASLGLVQAASVATSFLGVVFIAQIPLRGLLVVVQVVLAMALAALAVSTDLPFVSFCLLRIAFGACRAPLISAVMAAVGTWVPEERRGWTTSWIETSYWLADLALPLAGITLAGSKAAWFRLLAALALFHAVVGMLMWKTFPVREQASKTQAAVAAPSSYRNLLLREPSTCLLWSFAAHTSQYTFMTIIGVWWHDAFGLDSVQTGCSAIVIGIGNVCGFLLNLFLTDKFGAEKAVVWATCATSICFLGLCILGLSDLLNFPLALSATLLVFAFAEFGFLAAMTWATVACPAGVTQLSMSLAYRGAAGAGSCVGTVCALLLYRINGIACNAGLAALLFLISLARMVWK